MDKYQYGTQVHYCGKCEKKEEEVGVKGGGKAFNCVTKSRRDVSEIPSGRLQLCCRRMRQKKRKKVE